MSLTLHWRRPYEHLLHELQQLHGGEILLPSDKSSSTYGEGNWVGPPLPTLRFTAENTPFFIDLSSAYQLHIYAIGHTPAEFKVYPIGLIEHVQAFLGVDGGVRSNNPEFDRQFITNTDAKDKSGQLQKPEVQQLVESLMPFAFVKFHGGGIHLALDIGPDKDLDASSVDQTIMILAKLLAVAT